VITSDVHDLFVACAGVAGALIELLFVVASLLSLVRVRQAQPGELRDAAFLVGLAVAFGLQLMFGLRSILHPHSSSPVVGISVLVIVCFLIGCGRQTGRSRTGNIVKPR